MEQVLENIKRIRTQKGYSHEYIAHELDIIAKWRTANWRKTIPN